MSSHVLPPWVREGDAAHGRTAFGSQLLLRPGKQAQSRDLSWKGLTQQEPVTEEVTHRSGVSRGRQSTPGHFTAAGEGHVTRQNGPMLQFTKGRLGVKSWPNEVNGSFAICFRWARISPLASEVGHP